MMTPAQVTARRQAMLDLSAPLRGKLQAIKAEIQALEAYQWDVLKNKPSPSLTRTCDRLWDLRAMQGLVCSTIDAQTDAYCAANPVH